MPSSPRHQIVRPLLLPTILWAVILSTIPGCQLLSGQTGEKLDRFGLRWQTLGAGRNAIQLEFMSVRRPKGDPLLGESLWNRLDTIGRRPASMRSALSSQGLRVGQVGATPPPPLEELLGLSAPEHDTDNPSGRPPRRDLNGWRVFLQDGGDTEVMLHDEPLATEELSLNGDDSTTTFHNVRYLLRIRARQLREGWVRLECLPEVHHGRRRLQPTATEAGWGLRTRQEIVPLYDLKFTVDLTEGEMAVVSSTPTDSSESIGHRFFTSSDGRGQLLVARLAGVPKSPQLPPRTADDNPK